MWQDVAISITVFLPLLGAGVIALIPKAREDSAKTVALIVSAVAFAISLAILAGYDFSSGGLQFEVDVPWIEAIGSNYHVAIDGISLPLFVLSYLLTFLCAVYSFHHIEEPGKPKAFLALMLLLQTGMAGTFIAFDLILFFVFWELVLVPMYFMIGIWGGPRREYAAVKFFLYTLFGSVFMLVAFLALRFSSDPGTFDMVELGAPGPGRRVLRGVPAAGVPRASSWGSRSRCRCGRSTRGCLTRTPKPPPSARCCWLGSC